MNFAQICAFLWTRVNMLSSIVKRYMRDPVKLLTRCYVQYFLSPYIDSEVNHKRHFIKNPFINKSIEFIDLHSIIKDNLVISSIPNYLNNSETPIICYKYNKPIIYTIFNFNKIVNDIAIDSNTPAF